MAAGTVHNAHLIEIGRSDGVPLMGVNIRVIDSNIWKGGNEMFQEEEKWTGGWMVLLLILSRSARRTMTQEDYMYGVVTS